MTLLVDVGITAGAADTSQYWYIGNPTRGKIGTAAIAPPDLMTRVETERIISMSVQRTSSRSLGPFVEYNAGTATLVLLNDDGALDPANLPQPAAGADIRIRWLYDGVTYPVFRGVVQSWLPELRSPTNAVIIVQIIDAFADLAGDKPVVLGAPAGGSEDTGARINRILGAISWPAADRDIALGDTTLQATTLDGTALELIQAAVLAEAGEFYIGPDGVAVFRNRRALLTETRSNTSQATFGSDIGGGELPYVGTPGLSDDISQLVNTVRATRAGGTQQTVSDTTSVARYRAKLAEESDLLHETDLETRNWALYILGQNAAPELRYTSLTLDARANPAQLYPQMIGRLLGDRITVVRRWPGVVDAREVLIRSIEHTWEYPAKWTTVWGLQPASTYSFWTIGHPTAGRIGRNAIAY
ncbi:hypothetical protein [Actinoplanes regularis]|uniref:hypothetical protein n=1 Tax=Actinoplanes regularis TaxID=52697 RepID=UPI002552305C|nr:hypothetical protein [Actinoplanes regularis]